MHSTQPRYCDYYHTMSYADFIAWIENGQPIEFAITVNYNELNGATK